MCRGATSNMKTLISLNRVNRHRKVIKVEIGISLKYFVVVVAIVLKEDTRFLFFSGVLQHSIR